MRNLKDIAMMDNICLELQIKEYDKDDPNWRYWSYLKGWRDCLKWISESHPVEKPVGCEIV